MLSAQLRARLKSSYARELGPFSYSNTTPMTMAMLPKTQEQETNIKLFDLEQRIHREAQAARYQISQENSSV